MRFEKFNLAFEITEELEKNRISLKDGDILVVSSKFSAVSEGRFVDLSKIVVTKEAKKVALSYRIKPELAQLVLNESDSILGGIPGFLLTLVGGVLAPNAGIDLSNAPQGWAILYPKKPQLSAMKLRRNLLGIIESKGRKIRRLGVIFSDSRVTPTRLGTVGVAIGSAGIRPTIDMRGMLDLFNNKLKVTLRGLADQIATAAEISMGEADESVPVVIVRGVDSAFEGPRTKFERMMTIAPEKCLIISGLKNSRN
ncbi:MAG TPA: coenzyme F420-0:L-glutamate ligase [Nitrososphaerales archaeon]|nr:coenzyme F420-0:L-glutamate ligase [Nitrososphaerales archaeon]